MTILLALYRIAHRFRCMTQESCWPCDTSPLRYYIIGLMADCFGLGYLIGYGVCSLLRDGGFL